MTSPPSSPQARRKLRAARLSLATAASLAAVKLATGLVTGSMAILAASIDSLLDILMSGVNYAAIRQADLPADEDHPFGHGKFETAASLVQVLVVSGCGLWIIIESLDRLRHGTTLTLVGGGVAVLGVSAGVSFLLARHLRQTGKATESTALQADALHFSMDVWTNLALGAGLFAAYRLGWSWLDPLLSILVALYILWEAGRLARQVLHDMLDTRLPPELQQRIDAIICSFSPHIISHHNLRTRRAGSQKIMDFHLQLCRHLSIQEAHDIADALEKRIEAELAPADVTIHMEPCEREGCSSLLSCVRPRP